MKTTILRDLTLPELKNKLKETGNNLFNLRIQLSKKVLDNPMKIREARKDIAKIKTIIKGKEDGQK